MSSLQEETIINYTHISIKTIQFKKQEIKKTLEKCYRIKVDIKYVFLFLLNSKNKIHIPNTHSQSHHL